MNEKVEIELREWHYRCGDGCCDDYGTELYLNGEKLEHPEGSTPNFLGEDVPNALKAVLLKLGFDVSVEYTYD